MILPPNMHDPLMRDQKLTLRGCLGLFIVFLMTLLLLWLTYKWSKEVSEAELPIVPTEAPEVQGAPIGIPQVNTRYLGRCGFLTAPNREKRRKNPAIS